MGSMGSPRSTTKATPVNSVAPRSTPKAEIQTGRFHNVRQIADWIEQTFQVRYSESGIKALLRRIGASYHKVSGFFWKADRKKQKAFVRKYRRHPARRVRPPGGISSMPAIPSGDWGCSTRAGCWSGRASTSVSATGASG